MIKIKLGNGETVIKVIGTSLLISSLDRVHPEIEIELTSRKSIHTLGLVLQKLEHNLEIKEEGNWRAELAKYASEADKHDGYEERE